MRAGWIIVAGLSSCGRFSFEDRRVAGDGPSGDVEAPLTCGATPAQPLGICANLVSTYLFDNPANLGLDAVGPNTMVDMISGAPLQSTDVPAGLGGHSILLDGASTVCIAAGFTFDSSKDHTLCWWAKPTALADLANQFAQFCQYDTWTINSGTDYHWTLNNCTTAVQMHFDVPNVYRLGEWVEICQTYQPSTLTRRVTIAGQSYTKVDPFPIEIAANRWCIGSYGGGGFFTGMIYRPMWFDRILTDPEMAEINLNRCCVQP